jgi:hypothetical protein
MTCSCTSVKLRSCSAVKLPAAPGLSCCFPCKCKRMGNGTSFCFVTNSRGDGGVHAHNFRPSIQRRQTTSIPTTTCKRSDLRCSCTSLQLRCRLGCSIGCRRRGAVLLWIPRGQQALGAHLLSPHARPNCQTRVRRPRSISNGDCVSGSHSGHVGGWRSP